LLLLKISLLLNQTNLSIALLTAAVPQPSFSAKEIGSKRIPPLAMFDFSKTL
jgi:hypothetical protein